MPTVTVRTFAAADGSVYPRWFEVGETVSGDLARVALEDKWATDTVNQPVVTAVVLPTTEQATSSSDDIFQEVEEAAVSAEPIPANWRSLSWARLRRLAMRISGGAVANKEEAIKVIAAAEQKQLQAP